MLKFAEIIGENGSIHACTFIHHISDDEHEHVLHMYTPVFTLFSLYLTL